MHSLVSNNTRNARHPLMTLFQYRDLLIAWTTRILRARYQQSVLGGLWALAQPVATVIILTTVFSRFLRVDTGEVPYLVFSYSALVPWLLFSTSVTDMTDSVVSNMNLVGKIYFPRDLLVVATLLARLVDFAIAYSLVLVLMVYFQLPLQASLLFLPVILLIQLMLALGLGLLGAALNVFYRDIKHILTLLLQLWFYATPIIYPVTLVPEHLRPFYYLNPMAGIVDGYRAVLIHGHWPEASLYLSALVALIVLGVGYVVFKRHEHQFSDVI
jgi:lipopolysaccharide transport system permease protein